MRLTWKDALATLFVGAAGVLCLLSAGGTMQPASPRGLAVGIFGLGIGACYTAKSQMAAVYGVAGTARPPLFYVVLVSALGAVALTSGVIAIITGGGVALAMLTGAMVALWALSSVRHQMSHTTSGVVHVTR
jgi:hypothetical protein